MTDRLYYNDSHRKEFEAKGLDCRPVKDKYEVVLDRTAFFPEGGGQYADTGYLDDVEVLDVKERKDVIFHTTAAPLDTGRTVAGRIDWEQRFDRMQQHTGEHIVSGLIHRRFGYDNVGFHLGGDYCTMDFNGPIPREALKEIEQEANRAVFQNLDIQISYPSKEELKELDYRSKIEIDGQVRVLTVPGYDVCACCAPHVKRTGEIGLIKLVGMVKYKGGERISMLCGSRALLDYEIKDENAKRISALLCAKEYEVADAVERMKEEQASLKGKLASFQQKLLSYQAAQIPVEDKVTAVFDPSLSGNAPRDLMNLLLGRGAAVCAVFTGTDEAGYRYVIGSRREDVRPLCRMLNEAFEGRGGGKPEMAQGSMKGSEEKIRDLIGNWI